MPQLETGNLRRAVDQLKESGFWVYGADSDGGVVYRQTLANKAALVLGAEGSGISRILREACDAFVAIPTYGKLDSLNVSVAAGVLLYEVTRQRKQ